MTEPYEPFSLEDDGLIYEVRKVEGEDLWWFLTYDDGFPNPFAWDQDREKVVLLAEQIRTRAVDPWNHKALKAECRRLGFDLKSQGYTEEEA